MDEAFWKMATGDKRLKGYDGIERGEREWVYNEGLVETKYAKEQDYTMMSSTESLEKKC